MYRVEIKNDEVTGALTALSARLGDMTPVMQEIGEYLVASTRGRFPEGRAPDGTAWAPKSPTTLKAYGARKSNRVDTRPLFGPSGTLSRNIFYRAFSDGVEVGSDRIYAAVMQFGAAKGAFGQTSRGGPIPWGNIPPRPFLGLSEVDEGNILAIIGEWAARAAEGGA
jgi:phage virion morphogenesis protein